MRLEPRVRHAGRFLRNLARRAPGSPQSHGPVGAAGREVRVALGECGDGSVVPGDVLDGALDLDPRVPDANLAIGTSGDDDCSREAIRLFPQGHHRADPAAVAFEHSTVLRYRHVVVEHHQPPVGNLTVLPSRHDRPQFGHPRHAHELGPPGLDVDLLHRPPLVLGSSLAGYD